MDTNTDLKISVPALEQNTQTKSTESEGLNKEHIAKSSQFQRVSTKI